MTFSEADGGCEQIVGNPEGILLKLALMGRHPPRLRREPAGHSCSSKARARRTTETMTKWALPKKF